VIAAVTAPSVAGMVVGTYARAKVPARHLRRGFAWFVIAMGLFVLAKEASLLIASLAAVVVIAVLLVVTRTRARPALTR
jgi:hypothetical protein